jgi:TM2 domain-containing membrane protein YozV
MAVVAPGVCVCCGNSLLAGRAFRRVFARLDLPYVPKRAQAAAVLLALFGGIIGLHHFYMGQTRKGICYAASFWLAIPMILGWIDAVWLALLTEPQFQARVIHSAAKRAAVK